MEAEDNQKGLERVLSQKALAMSSSFPCQICVVGFLCGVCLTSLFMASLTSFGHFQFNGIQFHHISAGILPWNSDSLITCKFYFLNELFLWETIGEMKDDLKIRCLCYCDTGYFNPYMRRICVSFSLMKWYVDWV